MMRCSRSWMGQAELHRSILCGKADRNLPGRQLQSMRVLTTGGSRACFPNIKSGSMTKDSADDVSASKLLSLVLRHEPGAIGIALDEHGWVDVEVLLARLQASGKHLSRTDLDRIVETSDKQRFALSTDRTRIRANQGHSIAIELQLVPQAPPSTLHHGTATRFLASILEEGLKPGARNHVHLSTSSAIALAVGARHGKPVVLRVDSQAMHVAGHTFYVSANGVWLTAHVPPSYLQPASEA